MNQFCGVHAVESETTETPRDLESDSEPLNREHGSKLALTPDLWVAALRRANKVPGEQCS